MPDIYSYFGVVFVNQSHLLYFSFVSSLATFLHLHLSLSLFHSSSYTLSFFFHSIALIHPYPPRNLSHHHSLSTHAQSLRKLTQVHSLLFHPLPASLTTQPFSSSWFTQHSHSLFTRHCAIHTQYSPSLSTHPHSVFTLTRDAAHAVTTFWRSALLDSSGPWWRVFHTGNSKSEIAKRASISPAFVGPTPPGS